MAALVSLSSALRRHWGYKMARGTGWSGAGGLALKGPQRGTPGALSCGSLEYAHSLLRRLTEKKELCLFKDRICV